MNYYPLFRVRSRNNGMRCMYFYILISIIFPTASEWFSIEICNHYMLKQEMICLCRWLMQTLDKTDLSVVPYGTIDRWLQGPINGPLARYEKIAGAHAPGMPGTFSPPSGTSDPDMHHGTCVTHVPWCMPGSLTSVFLWSQWRGKTFPAFPAHAQPAILRIWQEAHGGLALTVLCGTPQQGHMT